MHYVAVIEGTERTVHITKIEAGRYRVVIDGQETLADAYVSADHTISLLIDEEAFDVQQAGNGQGASTVYVRDHAVTLEMLDLRALRKRHAQSLTGAADGPATISAPMPGKVVAVLVEPGQEVQEGQALVVVEAMKMENELRSPKAGVVASISIQAGAAVEGGAVLCVVE